MSEKDFIRDFKLTSNIPLKYGDYKIKVNFVLDLTYEQKDLFFTTRPTEKKVQSVVYSINRLNNYTDTKRVTFESVVAGVEGGAFGATTFNIKLVDAIISYEVERVE